MKTNQEPTNAEGIPFSREREVRQRLEMERTSKSYEQLITDAVEEMQDRIQALVSEDFRHFNYKQDVRQILLSLLARNEEALTVREERYLKEQSNKVPHGLRTL